MSDPRRVTHRAPSGLPNADALVRRPRVVVVGAGIAGLAAATGLAERGVDVDVVEREPYLGGRVGGWTDAVDGTDVGMNRGFHAFFRQYYNLRALLRRVDPALPMLIPVDDYPLIDADGRSDTFRGLPRTPPLNALAFALRSPTFRLRDLLRLDTRKASPLLAVSVPDVYDQLDEIDADRFLTDINFPYAARHLAFEVFSRSFFSRPRDLSAAELAAMFHIYFLGSSEGLLFDVANANFDAALWNPLRARLEERGVTFHRGSVLRTAPRADGFVVDIDTGAWLSGDGVVLATDVRGLRAIVDASPSLGTEHWRASVAALGGAAPFVVQRLWLDRPVADSRPAFLATGGQPPLDNISVLNRYEREARQWAADTGGAVVELHAYAVTTDPDEVTPDLLARLHQLYPETAAARVVGERTLVRADCPRFAPGDFAGRPTVATPQPGLVLAGDGIRVDLPVALMERAATTGWLAANALLARFGLSGHDLQTVPTSGRYRPLHRLAEGRFQP